MNCLFNSGTTSSVDSGEERKQMKETEFTATSAIITINEDSIIQTVDKECCAMFGYDFAELIGQKITTLIPSPYKEQHDTYVANYLTTNVKHILTQSRMVEGLSKSNHVFPVRLSVSEYMMKGNRLFVGVIDRVFKFSGVIQATSGGIIMSINSRIEQMFGYSASELIGAPLSIISPEPYASQHDSYISKWDSSMLKYTKSLKLCEQPKLPQFLVLGRTFNFPGLHKDGNVFPISLTVVPLKIGENSCLLTVNIEPTDGHAVFTVTDSGEINSCTQTYVYPLFGRHSHSLIGTKLQNLISLSNTTQKSTTSSLNYSTLSLAESHSTANVSSVDNGSDSTSFDWKHGGNGYALHSNGSYIPVKLIVYPLLLREGSAPLYSVTIRGSSTSDNDTNTLSDSNEVFTQHTGFVLGQRIGRGSYGLVRLAHHKTTGQSAAVKTIYKGLVQRAVNEVSLLNRLSHPNITSLLGTHRSENRLYLILEYNPGGDLVDYLNTFPNQIPLSKKPAVCFHNWCLPFNIVIQRKLPIEMFPCTILC